MIHVPGIGPEKSVALERGCIFMEIFFGDDSGIDRHVWDTRWEPSALITNICGERWLNPPIGTSSPKQKSHELRNVGVEAGAGAIEIFLVKALVLPLAVWILRFWIDRSIDQRYQI